MKATVGRSQLGVLAVVTAVIVAACALVLVNSTQASAQTTAQPLLEFEFDEGSGTTATNTGTTGGALNGTIGSQVTYSTDTPLGIGSSLEFDGSGAWNSVDDRVDVPQAYSSSGQPLRDYPGDKLTIEAWVKPDATDGQRLLWDDYGQPGVVLAVLNGQVQFAVSTTASGYNAAGVVGGPLEVGKWQHITGVYDGTGLKICMDGKDTGAFTPTSGNIISLADHDPSQSAWLGTGNLVFDGKIDDFRVHTQALGCDEVAGGYFADTTKPTTTATPSVEPNGAGWNKENVTVTLNATDNEGGSGVKEITYSVNGDQPTTEQGDSVEVPVTAEGVNTIAFYATDNAGNTEEEQTITVKIDKTPPAVSSTSPANNATGVSATDKISATFSESGAGIDPSTLTTSTFKVVQVKPTGNVPVSGTVSYDESSKTATFTPDSKLAKGAYQATITTGVEDKADNALANDYTWQFATAGPSR